MKRSLAVAEVAHTRVVARDTVVMGLAIELDEPPRAGQFAMVHPLLPGMLLPRPFSILRYADGVMDLLVKEVGRGSRALMDMVPGDRARVLAPLGRAFDDPRLHAAPAILVAGGVGVVPLHMLSRERHARGAGDTLCLFGARSPADLPTELFEDGSGPWELWVEEGAGPGHGKGRVTVGLERALDARPGAVVATCGPTPMMKAVASICAARGVPLWVCLEEQMGCGSGVCRACVVPAAGGERMCTVCSDGPVFALDEIEFLPDHVPHP